MTKEVTPDRILQLGLGFWGPKTLLSAVELGVFIETPGGFDYTGADCCRWLEEAGFRQMRVEHLLGPDSMVVGVK